MNTTYFKYATFAFTFLGIVFSLLNIFDTSEILCLTSSCEVFSEFTLFGISLWIYSAVFFGFLFGLLCIKKFLLVFILASIGLLGDMFLLALMLVTAPCFSCLIIALILALVTIASYKTCFTNKYIFIFVGLWFLLFLVNAGAIIKASTMPYAIYMNEIHKENPMQASMRIYFSPSCSACSDLVDLLGSAEATKANDIVWLPVAEASEDVAKVVEMQKYIHEGDSLKLALEKIKQEAQTSSNDTMQSSFITDFFMQAKLLINQSRLHAAGTNRIPFIEYTGVPAFLTKKQSIKTINTSNPLEALGNMSKPNTNSSNTTLEEVLNFGVEAYCDDTSLTEPCE